MIWHTLLIILNHSYGSIIMVHVLYWIGFYLIVLLVNAGKQGSITTVIAHWGYGFKQSLMLNIRVYSHLSCLARLNWTQVRFPLWCGSFVQVWIQQSHSGADQTTVSRWSRSASKQTLVRLNGWTNEWMTLAHVVLFTISGLLAKRAVWKRTKLKKINIVFGQDQKQVN